jgi:GntP family gluconate:H+ symporter
MLAADIWLLGISIGGIALAILLIARLGLHPFIGLLTGAFVTGLAAQLPPEKLAQTIEKGFGDILRGTGMVVALGLGLGAMLQISGGARALAKSVLDRTGDRYASLGGMVAALLIGMPLFFETGTVLLLPIIAAGMADKAQSGSLRLKVMLDLGGPVGSACADAAASGAADRGARAWRRSGAHDVDGPVGRYSHGADRRASAGAVDHTRGGDGKPALIEPDDDGDTGMAGADRPAAAGGADRGGGLDADGRGEVSPVVALLSDPVVALLIANAAGLLLLLGPRMVDRGLQDMIWREAMLPAGGILLGIGAGGALKQVLVDIGLPAMFGRMAQANFVGPVVMAWLVAAAIRVATGSATVATITASAIMAGVMGQQQVDPSLLVLAIGAGRCSFPTSMIRASGWSKPIWAPARDTSALGRCWKARSRWWAWPLC